MYLTKQLLGACADMWSGGTAGFYFETPATAIHLVQHGQFTGEARRISQMKIQNENEKKFEVIYSLEFNLP